MRSIEYSELLKDAQLDGLQDPYIYILRMIRAAAPRSSEKHDMICSLEQRTFVVWNSQYSRTTETPVFQTSRCGLATAAIIPTLIH